MGHAKRKEAQTAPRTPARRVPHTRSDPRRDVLDEKAVDRVLEPYIDPTDGDTVAGIRNAALVGAIIWSLLALVLF